MECFKGLSGSTILQPQPHTQKGTQVELDWSCKLTLHTVSSPRMCFSSPRSVLAGLFNMLLQ